MDRGVTDIPEMHVIAVRQSGLVDSGRMRRVFALQLQVALVRAWAAGCTESCRPQSLDLYVVPFFFLVSSRQLFQLLGEKEREQRSESNASFERHIQTIMRVQYQVVSRYI
jgi:hypothetical protein